MAVLECPDLLAWQALLAGQLDPARSADMRGHLETCDACAETSGSLALRWDQAADVLPVSNLELPEGTREWFDELAKGPTAARATLGRFSPQEPPEIPGLADLVEVGHGGMGVVFRAQEVALGRPVAVKVLTSAGRLSASAHLRAQREAQSLARLHHPHVVQIYRSGEIAGGLPYLVMEWISGGTVQEQLDRERFTPQAAAQLVRDLATAVAEAHTRGIVHRDLKPANVLLAPGGSPGAPPVPKLADFGLARPDDEEEDSRLTETGMTLGTPDYMAPEQTGLCPFLAEVGPATDIHGLGAILYALLTGRAPYLANTKQESLRLSAGGEYPSLVSQAATVPRDLVTIVEKALQTHPLRRFRTALELADELDRFIDGRPIHSRPISTPERMWKWARRHPVAAVSALLLTVATLAGIGGTIYHIHSMGLAIEQLSDSRQKIQNALELANTRGQQFQDSLSTFDDELIQRLMDRGSALDAGDRAFLLKVRQLYLSAPLEPDPLKALNNRAARLDRLGGVFYQINQYEDASLCQQSAIETYDQALKLAPDDLKMLKAKGALFVALHNSLLRMNRTAEAELVARQMVEHYQWLAGLDPFQRVYEAKALIKLGATLDLLQRFDESRQPVDRALEILERDQLDFTDSKEFWLIHIASLFNAGLSSRVAGRYQEAEDRLRGVLQLIEEPIKRFPEEAAAYREIEAMTLSSLIVVFHDSNKLKEAEAVAYQCLEMTRRAFLAVPEDARLRDAYGDTCGIYYEICRDQGKPREAEGELLEALKRATAAQQAEPAIFIRSRALIYLLEQTADLYQRTDRPAEAIVENQLLLNCARPWRDDQGYAAEVQRNITLALERMISIYSDMGDHTQARQLLRQQLEQCDPLDQPTIQARILLEQLSMVTGSAD